MREKNPETHIYNTEHSSEHVSSVTQEKESLHESSSVDSEIPHEFLTDTAEHLRRMLFAEAMGDHDALHDINNLIERLSPNADMISGQTQILKAITVALWEKLSENFKERFSIINSLGTLLISAEGEMEAWSNGYEEGLEYITHHDKNFFLRALSRTFLQEDTVNPPINERRAMIAYVWNEGGHNSENGGAWICTDVRNYPIPITAHSAEDLPEETVRTITDDFLREDISLGGYYGVREGYIMEKLRDDNLDGRVTNTTALNAVFEHPDKDFYYKLQDQLQETFVSSISPSRGALYSYHDGKIQDVFYKNDSGIAPTPVFKIGREFSMFLSQIDKIQSVQEAEGFKEDVRRFEPFLLKHPDLRDEIMAYLDGVTDSDALGGDPDFISKKARPMLEHAAIIMKEEMLPFTTPMNTVAEMLASEHALYLGAVYKDTLAEIYTAFSSVRMRTFFEEYFDFSFADVPIYAQLQLLKYVWDKNESDIRTARNFIHEGATPQEKTNRFVSFLSLEQGALPKEILGIGEKMPRDVADRVFAKYADLVDTAEHVRQLLFGSLPRETEVRVDVINEITNKLLSRGKTLLTNFADRRSADLADIPRAIEAMQTDIEFFKSTIKTLLEQGEFDINMIHGVSFETESGVNLKQNVADTEKIEKLLQDTYRNEPAMFRAKIISTFEQSLTNPATNFYVLKHDNELIVALRFDTVKDANGDTTGKYFGSFVSNPAYSNGKLGEAILEKALEVESHERVPIYAYCNPKSPITGKYIESGFIATGSESYSGVPSLAIVLEPELNERSETKRWSANRIVRATLEQNTDTIKAFATTTIDAIPFDLVSDGYSLVRYIKVDNLFYSVFERISEVS